MGLFTGEKEKEEKQSEFVTNEKRREGERDMRTQTREVSDLGKYLM